MIHQDKRMYKYLTNKISMNPWELRKTSMTFDIKFHNIKNNKLLLESKADVESPKRVSSRILDKPAQMESQKQRKYVVLPYTKRAGGHAQKAGGLGGPTSIEEKLGRNPIRARFIKKLLSRNERLKSAANKIGASLQV